MLERLIEIIIHSDDALPAVVSKNITLAYVILFLLIILETG